MQKTQPATGKSRAFDIQTNADNLKPIDKIKVGDVVKSIRDDDVKRNVRAKATMMRRAAGGPFSDQNYLKKEQNQDIFALKSSSFDALFYRRRVVNLVIPNIDFLNS